MSQQATTLEASKQPAYDIQQWEPAGFVGTRDRLSTEEFRQLITTLASPNIETPSGAHSEVTVGYFLRWAHRVSGWVNQLPETFPSPQGQMITATLELRWRRQRLGYDVLLLSTQAMDQASGFQPLSGLASEKDGFATAWETCLRPVLAHPRRGPQYPKAFTYSGLEASQLSQRYFRNAQTGIVQFVALSLVSTAQSEKQTNPTQLEVKSHE